MSEAHSLPVIGWREWVALPGLGIPRIKAKVDTGAKTSALHAFFVEGFVENGVQKVRFAVHPEQKSDRKVCKATATVIDRRTVTDSGGHREERWVIKTELQIGDNRFPIEMTLTDRENMRFRMLLGREALKDRFSVNSAASYQIGKPRPSKSAKDAS